MCIRDSSNPRLEDHPDVAAFFERMTYIPLAGITQMVPPGGAGVGMHVIPVEKAISMENEAIDIEKLSYWLEKYEGKIGVGRCSCRASRKAIDDGCADDDFGWCIGVGDFADYCRETGKGHDITKEEALAILKRAEDNGFVHQITNIDGENKIFGICNCNVEICNALRTSQLFNTPNMSRSAYVAHVEKDKCVACGRCVEYCPAGACLLYTSATVVALVLAMFPWNLLGSGIGTSLPMRIVVVVFALLADYHCLLYTSRCV